MGEDVPPHDRKGGRDEEGDAEGMSQTECPMPQHVHADGGDRESQPGSSSPQPLSPPVAGIPELSRQESGYEAGDDSLAPSTHERASVAARSVSLSYRVGRSHSRSSISSSPATLRRPTIGHAATGLPRRVGPGRDIAPKPAGFRSGLDRRRRRSPQYWASTPLGMVREPSPLRFQRCLTSTDGKSIARY